MDFQEEIAMVNFHITPDFDYSMLVYFLHSTDNPSAVSFVAVIGGGTVGLFLLILIALVLLVILIWVARQLKREKAIAAAG